MRSPQVEAETAERTWTADRIALALRFACDALLIPLARNAWRLTARRSWTLFGFARSDDYARERLTRTGRWLRDVAALGRALDEVPALTAAVTGADGGAPLGRAAALLLARVVRDTTVHDWIALARRSTVRRLRQSVSAARANPSASLSDACNIASSATPRAVGSKITESSETQDSPPVAAPSVHASTADGEEARRHGSELRESGDGAMNESRDDTHDRREVRFLVPEPLRAAFEETLELHRAVEGRESTVQSFIEALVAEAHAGLLPPDVEALPLSKAPPSGFQEDLLAKSTSCWKHLPVPFAPAMRDSTAWSWRSDPKSLALGPSDESRETGVALTVAVAPHETIASGELKGKSEGRERDPTTTLDGSSAADAKFRTADSNGAAADPSAPLLGEDRLSAAARTLTELQRLEAPYRDDDPVRVDDRLRALLRLDERLQRQLGSVLAEMGDRGAWATLMFRGVEHYGEERLGISRSSASDRARLHRALRDLPRLREAYQSGRVGAEAALLVVRALGRGPVDEELEQAWVARACECTVKRLRDEVRVVRRLRHDPIEDAIDGEPGVDSALEEVASAGDPSQRPSEHSRVGGSNVGAALSGRESGPSGPSGRARQETAGHQLPACVARARFPLSDRQWHAWLFRKPGTTARRVLRLSRAAIERPTPDVFLRLRLDGDLADSLLAAVESRRREVWRRAEAVPWFEDWPQPDAPPSVLAARTYSVRSRRPPAWIGLLAVLEEYIATWDDPRAAVRRAGDRVYQRDGYRCSAPCCTSRRVLEDHHVKYRSRGGGHHPSNRTCACRFHHQLGEHGGLASVRGTAPLDLVWRLGRLDVATWFYNERRLGDVRAAS